MTVDVREMDYADLDGVVALEEVTFSEAWSRRTFADELARARTRGWYVAEEDGALLGYGGVMVIDDEAHIMNIAVRGDRRREGVASALLDVLAGRARELGADRLTLEVRAENEAAIQFYRSVGMQLAGERRSYYGPGAHALIMGAAIDDVGTGGGVPAESSHVAEAQESRSGAELILAIETSCDETAAAVMRGGTELLSNVVASQVDFHARFGGVVPEIASRKHTEAIVGVVDEALARANVTFADLDAIAVTYGPGLIGALVVGVAYAKGLSFSTGLPLVGVNHLEGHIFAAALAEPDIAPPLVALVVSGGHTSLVHVPEWGVYHTLGQTLDDAAGEAFDKVAKVLGLGYPGGPVISKLAEEGDPTAIDFPRAMMHSGDYRFSLSGLKTAVINHIRNEREAGREMSLPDLAASFQAAVVDVQVAKTVRAAVELGVGTVCLAGGVAANPSLREGLRTALAERGIRLSVPPFAFCTDNAAMIAAAGTWRFRRGDRLGPAAEAVADLSLA